MKIWRILREKWHAQPLSGEGSRSQSGRWHHAGTPLVYTAESLALAAWEQFVHVQPGLAPPDLVYCEAELPDDASREILEVSALPARWRDYPGPEVLRDLGTRWVQSGRSLSLLVPSAVIPEERCVLINPVHPRFASIRVLRTEPFRFDHRSLSKR